MRRRKTPSSSQPTSVLNNQQRIEPCVKVGSFGLDGKINQPKRDKKVLMSDLVKLQQQQQNSRTYLQDMGQRPKKTESKQRQMTSFLARAVQNPGFLWQLVERRDKKQGIEDAPEKKRRRTINRAPSDANHCEVSNFEVGEVEMFDGAGLKEASDDRMNGFVEEEQQPKQQGIWEDFMNGRVEQEMGLGSDVVAFEDADVWIDGLEDYNVANLDYIYGSK